MTKPESQQMVAPLFAIMKATLSDGEGLLISGFGKFSVRQKNARRGRNPQTRESLILKARKILVFKVSIVFRNRLNIPGRFDKKYEKNQINYLGKWRIIEMEMWDQDFIDLVTPGYFSFDKDELGYFQFGAVEGRIDYKIEKVGNIERLEFSWEGADDNDSA